MHQEKAHWLTTPETLFQCDTKGTWQNSPKNRTRNELFCCTNLLALLQPRDSKPANDLCKSCCIFLHVTESQRDKSTARRIHTRQANQGNKKKRTEKNPQRQPSQRERNKRKGFESIPDCIDCLQPNWFRGLHTSQRGAFISNERYKQPASRCLCHTISVSFIQRCPPISSAPLSNVKSGLTSRHQCKQPLANVKSVLSSKISTM